MGDHTGENSAEPGEKLIIGCDFGTTFSGISYCFPNRSTAKVAAVENWPGIDGEIVQSPKIPTLISYDGTKENFTWGASVNRMGNNIVAVKLLLDPEQERPLYLPTGNIKRGLKKLPKSPQETAVDFISAMYGHALEEIAKEVPKAYMDICQKEFVFTVPAVWSDAAKNATVQAAKYAGMFPVLLIKEPEAAALHTLHDLNFTLNVGDAFILCDAGGGTADLISYEVEEVRPRLKLKELVPGTGGMAGSLGLNQRFAEAVHNLVGEDQWISLKNSKALFLAEKQFDQEIKRSFAGKSGEEYFVNFPMASLEDDDDSNLISNTWTMTGQDVKDIFAPLITDILRMIDDQVKSIQIKRPTKAITGIFLVGGLGSNQYLRQCVIKQHPEIHVLQPSDAWSAIVKGAALSKLPEEAMVGSTSATRHYGVEAWSEYEEHIDSGEVTQVRRDGRTRARRFTWYINIDDDLRRDHKITFPFFREIDINYTPQDLLFRERLYDCQDRIAPIHRSKGQKFGTNCTFTADLCRVPASKFHMKYDRQGLPYYEVHYNLVIKLESALMTFSLEIDGETLGSVEAKYGNETIMKD